MIIKIGSSLTGAITIQGEIARDNLSTLILGVSGTGKTHAASQIAAELVRHGIKIIMLDHRHSVSLPTDLKAVSCCWNIAEKPLRFPLFPVSSANKTAPTEIASVFTDAIAQVIHLSPSQKSLLLQLSEEAACSSDGLDDFLQSLNQKIANSSSRSSPCLRNALAPLFDQTLFENGDLDLSSCLTLLDLSDLSQATQCIVTELFLSTLLRIASCGKLPPTFLYLDELSNYTLRPSNALGRILCEGRKYGLYCLLIAQSAHSFTPTQRTLLGQCQYKLFFRPAAEDARMCSDLYGPSDSGSKTKLTTMLKSLLIGEFYASGPIYCEGSIRTTSTPFIIHSQPPENEVSLDNPLLPDFPDSGPILPPAPIEFLPSAKQLSDYTLEEDCIKETEVQPVNEEQVFFSPSNLCDKLVSVSESLQSAPLVSSASKSSLLEKVISRSSMSNSFCDNYYNDYINESSKTQLLSLASTDISFRPAMRHGSNELFFQPPMDRK